MERRAATPIPLLLANRPRGVRVRRAKHPKPRRYIRAFELPQSGQFLILNAPIVRAHLQAERRLMLVKIANSLAPAMSQNAIASCLSCCPSALSKWRKDYAERGFEALITRRGGPTAKVRSGAVCTLELIVRG